MICSNSGRSGPARRAHAFWSIRRSASPASSMSLGATACRTISARSATPWRDMECGQARSCSSPLLGRPRCATWSEISSMRRSSRSTSCNTRPDRRSAWPSRASAASINGVFQRTISKRFWSARQTPTPACGRLISSTVKARFADPAQSRFCRTWTRCWSPRRTWAQLTPQWPGATRTRPVRRRPSSICQIARTGTPTTRSRALLIRERATATSGPNPNKGPRTA